MLGLFYEYDLSAEFFETAAVGVKIALQGEDHYVRIHTALGSELVLMRLGDAIQELDGLEGERVHRSWWVARRAVDQANK